jgi:hypothetical protein
MALPLDLQVADPAPIASPKQQLPGSSSTGAPTTQDDVVK